MRKKRYWGFLCLLFILMCLCVAGIRRETAEKDSGKILETVEALLAGEPAEVRRLRSMEVAETDEGHQEYYFSLLSEEEKRGYREMLEGFRRREKEFYLTLWENSQIDKVYHAVLKDHPELFWVHNRERVYKTTYGNARYSRFTPGYTYAENEIPEIQQALDAAFLEVVSLLPEHADAYETVKTVYTYLIDHTDYISSPHDQNIAGVFWKKGAVCAGYAGAVQYLLERLDIPCIYVDGSAQGSEDGHAWNIVGIDGQYYYVDATNGDQPEFLEGDAALMAEHKTIIYDYLCPFPQEYELCYTPSPEFAVPACTAEDRNFYVLNHGCFDEYEEQQIYDYCCMRLDNGAAVIRFKFSGKDAFSRACEGLLENAGVERVARYYMELRGISAVQYHYGVLEHLNTIYLMF